MGSLANRRYNQLKVREFLTFAVCLSPEDLSRVIAQLELMKDDKNNQIKPGEKYSEEQC